MLKEQLELTSWCHHGYVPLEYGEELDLVPEPENEYDPDAIAIYKGSEMVGYVPAHQTKVIHAALDSGERLTATVTLDGDAELGINPSVLVTNSAVNGTAGRESKKNSADLPTWLSLPLGLVLLIGGLIVCVTAFFHLFDGTLFPRLGIGCVMLGAAYLVMR